MSDELNPDLFDEDFEEDFEDGFDELDLDDEDLEDLEADLADYDSDAEEAIQHLKKRPTQTKPPDFNSRGALFFPSLAR